MGAATHATFPHGLPRAIMATMAPSQDTPPAAGGRLDASYARARTGSLALRYRYRARARVVGDAIERHLPFKGWYEVLDLGAADGRTLLEVRRLVGGRGRGRFVGVEASSDLVAAAPALPEDTRLVVGDATTPPGTVGEAPFDVVMALAVLEHLPSPDALVDAAYRSLKPGGIFVATAPHPGWDRWADRLGLGGADDHVQDLDLRALQRLAERIGPVEAFPFMFAPLATLPYLRVPIPVGTSATVDALLRRLPAGVTGPWCVNQAVVAVKA